MGQDQLNQMLETLGSVGVVAPGLALGAGLLLWLLGRRLAKPACAFSGLVLGGIGGVVLGESLVDQGGIMLALIIGAAIAGALLAALLFRVWMAMTGALIFGGVAAAAVLLWQQAPVDEPTETATAEVSSLVGDESDAEADGEGGLKIELPIDALTEPIRDGISSAIGGGDEGTGETTAGEADGGPTISIDQEAAAKIGHAILDALRGMAGYYREALGEWWAEAGSGVRGTVMIVGLIAAGIGLLIGLIGPYFAASIQSATAGSILMLFSSFSLLAQLMPEHLHWLPASPRGVLICLGLLAIIGLALQWTFFAEKTDK